MKADDFSKNKKQKYMLSETVIKDESSIHSFQIGYLYILNWSVVQNVL